ncbi:MAG: hypothetical protein H0U95_00935 [Bacteroidetes bacterium]|nr:hypothetical protein [Bacteroidota bacterium]
MKKILALFLIFLGSGFVIYSLMVLASCFALLSSTEFNSVGIGYSIGTLFGPLLLIAFSRWMIRRGIKLFKQNSPLTK